MPLIAALLGNVRKCRDPDAQLAADTKSQGYEPTPH